MHDRDTMTMGAVMADSPEYPDLRWISPRSWTNANRTSVQLIVIHTTEGSEHTLSAEDGAAYDEIRTDGTSTHFFHDVNSTVQCVHTADIAHAARRQGNLRGIHHELCGKAGQGATGWSDPNSIGTLRQAARQCARDALKWNIPVRRLTPAQVAAGAKGFCGHADVTYAFPQDNGTHTDPGPTFPWTLFLGMVDEEIEGETMTPADVQEACEKAFRSVLYGAKNAAVNGNDPNVDNNDRAVRDALWKLGERNRDNIIREVQGVDEALFGKLSNPDSTDQEVALVLTELLGSRRAAIVALMQG